MALTIVFHNDSTGNEDVGNYNVYVLVNEHPIAIGRVEGHPRAEGWETLAKTFLSAPEAINHDATEAQLALDKARAAWRKVTEEQLTNTMKRRLSHKVKDP